MSATFTDISSESLSYGWPRLQAGQWLNNLIVPFGIAQHLDKKYARSTAYHMPHDAQWHSPIRTHAKTLGFGLGRREEEDTGAISRWPPPIVVQRLSGFRWLLWLLLSTWEVPIHTYPSKKAHSLPITPHFTITG
jgi:hypothetical protein